jgi:hypothetical protein
MAIGLPWSPRAGKVPRFYFLVKAIKFRANQRLSQRAELSQVLLRKWDKPAVYCQFLEQILAQK